MAHTQALSGKGVRTLGRTPAPAAVQTSARAAAATDGPSEGLLQAWTDTPTPTPVRSAPEPRFPTTSLIANLRNILRAVADRTVADRIVSTTRGPEMPYVAWTHHSAYPRRHR